jgi:drug/metabolite transporter (DMT)-like permease
MTAWLRVHSRRGAYIAVVLLTLLWGTNWIAMKLVLLNADPVVFNVQRTLVAAVVLFAAMLAGGGPRWPTSWRAVVITALLQTTLNFGATTMALASGGAGRTSVLCFTMPFWTMLLAWPILHERVRGTQWLAIAFAFSGLVLIVDPWHWSGDLTPKLWAILSGFGWACGTVAMKYFLRDERVDLLNLMAWQTLVGVIPFLALPLLFDFPATQWSVSQALLFIYVAVFAMAVGFLVWMQILRWLPAGTASLNMFAVPVIALLMSMALFGERLTASEWAGIASVGAGLAVLSARAVRTARAETLPPQGEAG